MEIRGVNTTLINNYPKSEEITKKKVKTSFLSKWKKIGITYGLVYNVFIHRVYGGDSLGFDEASVAGMFPVEREGFHTISFLGKGREISESTYNIMKWVESISICVFLILLMIIFGYMIWSIVYHIRHKEKPKLGVEIKIIIALAIILELVLLAFKYMIIL